MVVSCWQSTATPGFKTVSLQHRLLLKVILLWWGTIGWALYRGYCSRGLEEIRPSLRSEQREQTSWSNCHRCPTTLCHVNLSEKEARAAERCPRCHGLICEVTDSPCVRLWRENKTTEKSRGRLSWPFVLQGSGSLCESDNNFKGPCLPEHLWQVCVGMCAGVKAATLKP